MAAARPKSDSRPERILVIKLSALGDFIQSLGAFRAIREHHRGARVTLLTTAPFVAMAETCGYFDEVWEDTRPGWWQVGAWRRHIRKLRRAGFARVYDLQRSQRTGWYFRLLGPRPPEWVGIVGGCSHRYVDPPEDTHIMVRHAGMLALAGIPRVPPPDLSFLRADVGRFSLPTPYALLVPGSSAHRTIKRWPADRFAGLAQALAGDGITPVLIGGPAERAVLDAIVQACPTARDLCGQTGIAELATLARGARLAVGNDTGPLHIAAAAGCPTVALFSQESHAVRSRPPGPKVAIVQKPYLRDLSVPEVLAAIDALLRGG